MDGIIKQIEKGKPFFEKISRNSYLGAVRDGFLTAMPAILFSSIFILIAAVPEIFGYQWPEAVSTWLWKVYNYSMGVVGLLVSATTARCLADSMNRRLQHDFCDAGFCGKFPVVKRLSNRRRIFNGIHGDKGAFGVLCRCIFNS